MSTGQTRRSDLVESRWGVGSGVKLLSQPARHSTSNFHQTLRPVEQTTRPFESTIMPLKQIKPYPHPSRDHTRSSEQQLDQPRQPQQMQRHSMASLPRKPSHRPQARRRESIVERTSRPVPNHRVIATHETQQLQRQSQHISSHRASSVELRPLNRISNHRTSAPHVQKPVQPPPQDPLRLSDLVHHPTVCENYVDMADSRRRKIMARMNESVQVTMAAMLPDGLDKKQWMLKLKLEKKNITCYVDEANATPGQTRICCVSHTHATVDELMSLFLPTDQEALTRNNKVLHDNLAEARVLSVLREPTKKRPMKSMYVRYSRFQTPCPLTKRETCVAVATDMICQPDGSTIGYCLWDSVNDIEFAGAAGESSSTFRSGFFFHHSRRGQPTSEEMTLGQTKIMYMVGMEAGGALASGLTTRLQMEKSGSILKRLCSHLRQKHFDSRTFVTKTQWSSKCSAKSCHQCDKSFQVLSNRVNCHACGQVVCRSCVSKESVEVHSIGLVTMHICFSCIEKAGLPAPASVQRARSSFRKRRLHSDTASMLRISVRSQTQSPTRQSVSDVDVDFLDDDDDPESGEWAITTLGVPVRT
ncbi:unnamed protein product [Phytophthora lilii]|uniref:Unnamed protein product n=1 Tax=Phytophthora lilii TaxID=2077276 RepID=A0A9W6WL93_9STRA|nr:unnamed protein product [Phytophthora lilii]